MMRKHGFLWLVAVALRLCFEFLIVRSIRIDPLSASTAKQKASEEFLQHRRLASTVNVDVPDSPDGHLVTSLPLWRGDPFPTKHWAGHLPASANGDKYFFYWLFAPDLSASSKLEPDVPVILWLNGGPACSSMDGLFLENGPFRLTQDENKKYGVTADPNSWNKAPAYTLYIDQPVGTGLSFTTSSKYPTNDEEVNIDFYYFLQSFLKLHEDKFVNSENTFNRGLFFSGESHAGHYIPSMMNFILKTNEKLSPGEIRVPVAGAAIGNGWIDPYYQYAAAEAAYGHGLVGRAQVNAFAVKEESCQQHLLKGEYSSNVCFTLLDEIVAQSHGSDSHFKVSTYDARRSEPKGAPRTFPPGHTVVETYLGGWDLKLVDGELSTDVFTEVLESVHASAATEAGQRYKECTDPPYEALAHQDGKGVVADVVDILEHSDNVRLLFFNGMEDLICNHVGNEKLLENLPWKGRDEWVLGKRYSWVSKLEEEGKVSGYAKEHDNLLFLKLLSSGHMVPLDIPETALDMMRTFINSESFETSIQSLSNKGSQEKNCPVCPTCEECEVCPKETSKDTTETPEAAVTSNTGILAGLAGLVVGAAVVIGLAVIFFFFRKRRPQMSRSRVPQYDLELREGQYSDNGYT